MSDALVWLIAANALIWAGLGLYVAFLAFSQKVLRARCRQLEIMINERND